MAPTERSAAGEEDRAGCVDAISAQALGISIDSLLRVDTPARHEPPDDLLSAYVPRVLESLRIVERAVLIDVIAGYADRSGPWGRAVNNEHRWLLDFSHEIWDQAVLDTSVEKFNAWADFRRGLKPQTEEQGVPNPSSPVDDDVS